MKYETIQDKLKDIKIEEFVWIIYIGIIFLSFYSNSLEKRYFLYGDIVSKKKYRQTLIAIFSILTIVYLYFLNDAYDSLKKIKPNDNYEKKKLLYLAFVASLLIAISGFIFLYIAYKDESIDVEIAFN